MAISSSRPLDPGRPPAHAEGHATRRRGAVLERAILQAAWEELLAVGYADLTMEGVAARAKTSRAVLYRRWPQRGDLVLAAMLQQAPPRPFDIPDAGDLRADVLALLRRVVVRYQEVTPILPVLVTEYVKNPEFSAHLQARALVPGRETMTTILKRAADRGEVQLDKVTGRIAALPIHLTLQDLFLGSAPTTESTLTEIIDDIFLPLVRHQSPTER